MKDGKTILLLIVSLCLVATWGYHIYDKSHYSSPEIQTKEDSANQQTVNDSLQRNYANALIRLGTVQVDKDSLNTELNQKINEIDSLRTEVNIILNVNNITKDELKKAEDKILVLEQKVNQFNKGAQSRGDVLVKKTKNNVIEQRPSVETKKTTDVKSGVATNLIATNASIKAMVSGTGNSTTKAETAEYLTVACSLQNGSATLNNDEIYIVVTAPGGTVIQDDQWQAGMFSSANGTRIPYTRKSILSYTNGEMKKISFIIKPAGIEWGLYTVQIYHKGQRIGKADLKLN